MSGSPKERERLFMDADWQQEQRDKSSMFGDGNTALDTDDCLPTTPWHNPCAHGPLGSGWYNVPTLLLVAAAFPEIMDCIPTSHLDSILDKCDLGLYFATGELRNTASSAGFTNIWEYLMDIDAKIRRTPVSSPTDR
jgi:hypothetical protein